MTIKDLKSILIQRGVRLYMGTSVIFSGTLSDIKEESCFNDLIVTRIQTNLWKVSVWVR